jgi:hypothetical protein
MSYFDATLDAEPVAEQNNDPILPEERFVFELIGFERSEPDQWHKKGGIKWTFRTFLEDGITPFVFQDEQYQLWRTTNINKDGKPLFTIGTQAHDWAQALLGRSLGVDAHFSVSELRGKRMSSMVVWQPKKTKPGEKAATLASLRHVPVGAPNGTNGTGSKSAVEPDANSDDIDRALAIGKFEKKIERARKKNLPSLKTFTDAHAAIVATTTIGEIEAVIESLDDALDAMDD